MKNEYIIEGQDNNIFAKEVLLEKLELNKDEAIELYSLDESFFKKE